MWSQKSDTRTLSMPMAAKDWKAASTSSWVFASSSRGSSWISDSWVGEAPAGAHRTDAATAARITALRMTRCLDKGLEGTGLHPAAADGSVRNGSGPILSGPWRP